MKRTAVASPVTLQIAVNVSPASYEFLEKNSKDGDVNSTLSGWMSFWLDNQTRGGLMLAPEDHDHLAKLRDGTRFSSSRQLVRAIEEGLRRDEGQFAFTITVDPTYIQPLQEFAVQSGMTTEELVQNAFSMVTASNWLYDLTPADGRMIPFTAHMLQEIATARGKKVGNVDSTDVYALIGRGLRAPVEELAAA